MRDCQRALLRTFAAGMAVAALSAGIARADAVADFYSGTTVTLLIGYPAGDSYNAYGRTLASHIGRHIPGAPNVIVKQMPGAGSVVAANYLYNAAPQDGSVIGAVGRGVPTEPLIYGDRSKAKYEPREFHWVGSLTSEVSIGAVWQTSGITSIGEVRQKQVFIPTGGLSADSTVFVQLANVFLGTKFKLVCCFPGGASQNLAMERGEVNGRVGWSWSSVKSASHDWYKEGKIRPILQFGMQKHSDLPDVPLITDLVENPDHKRVVETLMVRQGTGRPYLLPPKVSADKVKAVRAAFQATLKDPAFLADAGKQNLELIHPMSGEEIAGLLDRAYATPKPILDQLAKVLDPKAADITQKQKSDGAAQ